MSLTDTQDQKDSISNQDQNDAKEFAQIRANMKAFLKTQSKNNLIKMVFEQLDLYIELRKQLKDLSESKGIENE